MEIDHWIILFFVYECIGIFLMQYEKEFHGPIGITFFIVFWPLVLIFRFLYNLF